MNREALARILNRTREEEEPAAADPGAAEQPEAVLRALLDRWAGMNEAAWSSEAVDRLTDEILDIFRDHPTEADTWYHAWRAAHPEARW